ncbi:MAG: hypothetical protein HY434_01335 [Candidatus Liptonbacteria bacterium]|nr:hypothetical protein [Candidatus Liptonbacteria bacterium]
MGPDYFRRELTVNFSIIIGSMVVFAGILYFFSQELSSEAEKIVARRLLINQRVSAIGTLAALKKDAPQADAYLHAMNWLLVAQDQLLEFPRWLDGLARVRQTGIKFSFHGNQVAPRENSPGYIPFSLDLQGGLQNLTDFLKDVEFQSPRFLAEIDNFDITKNESGYRLSANGRVFFQ